MYCKKCNNPALYLDNRWRCVKCREKAEADTGRWLCFALYPLAIFVCILMLVLWPVDKAAAQESPDASLDELYLTFSAPDSRVDGSAISPDDIALYEVTCGPRQLTVPGGESEYRIPLRDVISGIECSVIAQDTDSLQSKPATAVVSELAVIPCDCEEPSSDPQRLMFDFDSMDGWSSDMYPKYVEIKDSLVYSTGPGHYYLSSDGWTTPSSYRLTVKFSMAVDESDTSYAEYRFNIVDGRNFWLVRAYANGTFNLYQVSSGRGKLKWQFTNLPDSVVDLHVTPDNLLWEDRLIEFNGAADTRASIKLYNGGDGKGVAVDYVVIEAAQ